MAWARTEAGGWRPVAIAASGRPRLLTLIPAAQEDELRAFCDLVTRRLPGSGELTWALARFEMGCERLAPFEALTDYLLALRALLEPEGPGQRPARPAAGGDLRRPEERAELAQRVARAISLERAVITGMDSDERGISTLVDELAEHLRAILRDALCGHLDSDLCGLADELLAEAATPPLRPDPRRVRYPEGQTAPYSVSDGGRECFAHQALTRKSWGSYVVRGSATSRPSGPQRPARSASGVGRHRLRLGPCT